MCIEDDHIRHRTTLVARLSVAGGSMRTVSPLFDVVLHLCRWRFMDARGLRASDSGALQQEHFLGQSWVATPAPLEDLRKAENEWALAKLLAEVKSRDEPGLA